MKKLSVKVVGQFGSIPAQDFVNKLDEVDRESGAKRYFVRNVQDFVQDGFDVEIDYTLSNDTVGIRNMGDSLLNLDMEPVPASRNTFKARLVFALQLADELTGRFYTSLNKVNELVDQVLVVDNKLVFKFKPITEESFKNCVMAGCFISEVSKAILPVLETEAKVNKYMNAKSLSNMADGALAFHKYELESKNTDLGYGDVNYQVVSGKSGKILVVAPFELNARIVQAFYAAAKHEGLVVYDKFKVSK